MRFCLTVFLPIVMALAVYPVTRKSQKAGGALVILAAAVVLAMTAGLLLSPPPALELPGLCGGLSFACGSLRSIMAAASAAAWLCAALASPEYFRGAGHVARYYMFYLWTLGAVMGVFLAGNLLTLFVFFEMMSFTSYVWVAQNETPEAIRASETYLFIAVTGGLAMLMGLFLLYHGAGSLTLEVIAARADSLGMGRRIAIGLLMLAGFGAKAGMFPLHVWLPRSHPAAPAPASAVLSGILIKSGVFGIIAVTCYLLEGVEVWGNLLLILSVATMTLGALLAVFSTDLKRTLACSSMSQIGFILTGVSMTCLLGEHGVTAAWGAVLHILNHSLIKLTLFIAAGVVYFNVHSLNLDDLRGFGRGKPLLMLAFLSGACSVAGIPGFGGYISKTLLHESIVEYAEMLGHAGAQAWPYTLAEWLFLFSGGLTFAYMARLFYIIFIAPRAPGQNEGRRPYMSPATAAVLAAAALAMPALGLSAHVSMEKIAVYALDFMRQGGHLPGVRYFSLTNLRGAAISLCTGAAVLALVGFGWLTKRENGAGSCKNVWPAWIDLENSLYRPALRGLSYLGAIAARAVETLGTIIIYGAVDLIFLGAKSRVEPGCDENFAAYVRRKKRSDVQRSFSSDLLAAVVGIVVIVAFVLAAV